MDEANLDAILAQMDRQAVIAGVTSITRTAILELSLHGRKYGDMVAMGRARELMALAVEEAEFRQRQ